MSAQCARCGSSLDEKNLPRLPGVEVRCPKCQEPMAMPEMTMPFGGGATLVASKKSGGALSPDKRYALVVINGKEPGKVFPIGKARVTIGRSDCDIVLEDGELSRQHALVAIEGSAARVEDLGSTNGTFVDGQRVDHAALDNHSEFRVGSHELLFVMTDEDGPLAMN